MVGTPNSADATFFSLLHSLKRSSLHFICLFSTQSVTHHETLLQLRYQHFCKAGPVGGRAFTMASTQVKSHKPVQASLKTAGQKGTEHSQGAPLIWGFT